jgi:hypothetical protein
MAMGRRSRHRRLRGTVSLAVLLVAAGACAQEAGDPESGGEAATVDAGELVPLLVVEEDGIPATNYGDVPMTADDPDDYYQPPPTELCESADVELLGPSDIYSYLGDGGDYLYIDQWVTGETTDAAIARFEAGVEALDGCRGTVDEVDVTDTGVDDIRRYESTEAAEQDDYLGIVYARHGGVLMLLSVDALGPSDFGQDDIENLIEVALDKMTSLGRVQVAE